MRPLGATRARARRRSARGCAAAAPRSSTSSSTCATAPTGARTLQVRGALRRDGQRHRAASSRGARRRAASAAGAHARRDRRPGAVVARARPRSTTSRWPCRARRAGTPRRAARDPPRRRATVAQRPAACCCTARRSTRTPRAAATRCTGATWTRSWRELQAHRRQRHARPAPAHPGAARAPRRGGHPRLAGRRPGRRARRLDIARRRRWRTRPRERVRASVSQLQLHPSIIAWNLANEVAGNGHAGGQVAYVHDMARELHRRDPGPPGRARRLGHAPAEQPGRDLPPLDAVGTDQLRRLVRGLPRPRAETRAPASRRRGFSTSSRARSLLVTEFGAEANPRTDARARRLRYQARLLATTSRPTAPTPASRACSSGTCATSPLPRPSPAARSAAIPGIHIDAASTTRACSTTPAVPSPPPPPFAAPSPPWARASTRSARRHRELCGGEPPVRGA